MKQFVVDFFQEMKQIKEEYDQMNTKQIQTVLFKNKNLCVKKTDKLKAYCNDRFEYNQDEKLTKEIINKIQNNFFQFRHNTLRVEYDFKLCYDQFVPIEKHIIVPKESHIKEFLGFESLPINADQRNEFVEINIRLKEYYKKNEFLNKIQKIFLKFLLDKLIQKYPFFTKLIFFVQIYTGFSFGTVRKYYFKVQSKIKKITNYDFQCFTTLPLFYCKLCKIFMCDAHFDPQKIFGQVYNTQATNLMNKKYFSIKLKKNNYTINYECSNENCQTEMNYDKMILQKEYFSLIKLVNFLTSINLQNMCVQSFLLNVECSLIRFIHQNFYDLVQNEDWFTIDTFNNNKTLITQKKAHFEDIKNQSILGKIDKLEEQRFKNCCQCKGNCSLESKCKCKAFQRECIVGICKCNNKYSPSMSCFFTEDLCINTNYYYKVKQNFCIKKSNVCDGAGLYANVEFKKGDFLIHYPGELILEGESRQIILIHKMKNGSYLFDIDKEGVDSYDAQFYGNESRFINHMPIKYANCQAQLVRTIDGLITSFYATKDIQKGDEIFFDYGKQYCLPWKEQFDQKVQQYMDGKYINLKKTQESLQKKNKDLKQKGKR